MTMGRYASEIEQVNQDNQLAQFNNQFLKYDSTNNNSVTIHDVVTVANLAKSNNDNEVETGYHITVLYKGTAIENKTESELNNLIANDLGTYSGNDGQTLTKYKCKVTVDSKTAMVSKVEFTN